MSVPFGRRAVDFGPLIDYLNKTNRLKCFLRFLIVEIVGIKQYVEMIGVDRIVEALGIERIWAELSAKQREELRHLAQRDNPTPNEPTG